MNPAPATTRSRGYYLQLRNRYAPKPVKVIFVLESPPASGKYFYNPDGEVSEPLFKAMMKDVLEIAPESKREGLKEFCAHGYLIIDATYTPVNQLDDDEADGILCDDFESLVEDLRQYAERETELVLVKANVCELLESRLLAAGFDVINDGVRIPFPGTGQQGKFRIAIRRVLGKKPKP